MSITILTASDIDKLLADPSTLEHAIASQRDILIAFSASTSDKKDAQPQAIQIPPRITVTSDDVTALCMPSRVKVLERNDDEQGTGIGVKLVCVPHSADTGLPATTTLFDARTGRLRAVVNSRNLTALRNACGKSLIQTILKHLYLYPAQHRHCSSSPSPLFPPPQQLSSSSALARRPHTTLVYSVQPYRRSATLPSSADVKLPAFRRLSRTCKRRSDTSPCDP